jgi:hypothetical protein
MWKFGDKTLKCCVGNNKAFIAVHFWEYMKSKADIDIGFSPDHSQCIYLRLICCLSQE